MRVLIIGGTGFLGPDILRCLHQMGHDIVLFNRERPNRLGSSCVVHVVGDLRHFHDFRHEFKRLAPQVVLEDMFHFSCRDAQTVISTLKGIADRIVAISGTDVYRAYGRLFGTEPGAIEPVPLTEESALRQRLFPGIEGYDKLEVERALASDPDFPATILRLPPVYGPRARMHRIFHYLRKMEEDPDAIVLNMDFANWRWTHAYVENVAAAVATAVTDERASGRIYNLGEMKSTSTIEWVSRIGKATGWNGDVTTVPDSPMVEVSPFALMRINTAQDVTVDSTLMRRELGFSEPIDPDEALVRTIAWERSNPISGFYPRAIS